jgi:hypothetical protein
MANNNVLDPTARDTEWNNAWDVISRLAAARRVAMHEMRQGEQPARAFDAGAALRIAPPDPAASIVPIDPIQYARAIAEIEQASAALRRAEPALEAWLPDAAAASEPRNPRSVWILVGTIWIATVLAVAGAIASILYFLG